MSYIYFIGPFILTYDNWVINLLNKKFDPAKADFMGHLRPVKYTVPGKINIDRDHFYATQWASDNGHLDVIKYLYSKKALFGAVALGGACENGHLSIVKYLLSLKDFQISDYSFEQCIIEASRRGHLDIVKYLIPFRNSEENYDEAIKEASFGGYLEIVKYLDTQGDNTYYGAFERAKKMKNFEVMNYLLSKGVEGDGSNEFKIFIKRLQIKSLMQRV